MTYLGKSNDIDIQQLSSSIGEHLIETIIKWYDRMKLKIETAPRSTYNMTFDEARLYCFMCTHDGHKDWRLPTRQEWVALHGNAPTPVWLVEKDNVKWDIDWYVEPVRDIDD